MLTSLVHRIRRRRAERELQAQLPAALRLMAQALRAGMNVLQAFQLVATQSTGVVATMFTEIVQAVSTGRRLPQEVQRVARHWQSPDLDLMALTIVALSDTGGNMAHALARLSDGMQQRGQLRQRVRVYATQGTVSAAVITALPLLLCAVMACWMPRLIAPLWSTLPGGVVLMVALGLQVAGLCWMRRIVQVEV